MDKPRLPFWHFFNAIEKELSYERSISKYKSLLHAFEGNYISYDDEWKNFKGFCKALYLQNFNDSARFDELLEAAIIKEKDFMIAYLEKNTKKAEDIPQEKKETTESNDSIDQHRREDEAHISQDDKHNKKETVEKQVEEPIDMTGSRTYFYQPPAITQSITSTTHTSQANSQYLFTDEYFPVTRRQMVKGWQFLRYQETGGFTGNIDIPATVKQIASEGLFTTPKYEQGLRNREDALVIFADCLGSMMPFDELTQRLIYTAHHEGGHPRAPVYYFKNFPSGYVYRNANLTEPVKLKQALVKCNRNTTVAIVISDGGAARGNSDAARKMERAKMTSVLLETLKETCAHTVWLNPMPKHRWANTAAEEIAKKVHLMKPIIDDYHYNFQDMLRTILKHTNY